MEEVLLKTIAEIRARKRRDNEKPDHVLFYKDLLPELRSMIEKGFDGLVESGKVNRSNTINDMAYGDD